MKGKLPYMPIYIGEYLGDTEHLTAEQHGAYLLLIFSLWRHGGSLPNDPGKLARIAKVGLRRWHIVSRDLMPLFKVTDQTINHKRVDHELQKARALSEKRSASGSLGGRKPQKDAPFDPKRKPQNDAPLRPERSRNPLKTKKPPKANGLHPEPEPSTTVSPGGDTVVGDPAPKGPVPIRDDWQPSARCLELLEQDHFSRHEIEASRKAMIDWALSNGKRKADWNATLRNWVREDSRRANNGSSRAPPRSRRRTAFDVALDRIKEARESDEREGGDDAKIIQH